MPLPTFIFILLFFTHQNNNNSALQDHIGVTIKQENKMQIKVNGKVFDVRLENNITSKELQKRLPLQLNMKDLNSNEKFIYLDTGLPENPTNVNNINIGDIMLYGDNCIVIFYKSFNTTYQYTRIGKIVNPEGLESVLGKGSVQLDFQ